MLYDNNKAKLFFPLNLSNVLSINEFPGESKFCEILTNSSTIYEDSIGDYDGEQIWVGKNDNGLFYFFRNYGSCEYCDAYMADFDNFSSMPDDNKIKFATEIYEDILFFTDTISMVEFFETTHDFTDGNHLIKQMLDTIA